MNLKPFVFCFLFISLIASCKQKEIIDVDGDVYSVTFKDFNLGDTLRNTVSAEVNCQDGVGTTVKIDVFVGDSLIATAAGRRLLLSWNTLTMRDGKYNVKIVATGKSGDVKELTRSVVLSNALITIEKEALMGVFNVAADYVITDAGGKILNTTHLKKGMDKSTLSFYPATAFEGDEIHIIRTFKNPNIYMDCFLNVKRGSLLKQRLPDDEFKYPGIQPRPIPFKLNNIPGAHLVTISTDVAPPLYPFENSGDHIMYTPESKVLVQLEQDNKAMFNIFDIAAGISTLTLDASLCQTPSSSKTIHFPFAIKTGYLTVYGKPYPGYDERYTFANKKIAVDQVQYFFPGSFFDRMEAHLWYEKENIRFFHYYKDHIPENVQAMNVSAEVRNRALANFEVSLEGDFDFYRAIFDNRLPGTQYSDGLALVNVYSSKKDPQFKFPDVLKAAAVHEYGIESFNLSTLWIFNYDQPVDKSELFAYPGVYLWPEGGKEVTMAEVILN